MSARTSSRTSSSRSGSGSRHQLWHDVIDTSSTEIHHAHMELSQSLVGAAYCSSERMGGAFSQELVAMLAEGRKALASLTLLVFWEIWKERNARVFNNKHAPPLRKRLGCGS